MSGVALPCIPSSGSSRSFIPGSSSASGRSCYNEIAVIMILLWHATAAAADLHRVTQASYASELLKSHVVCLNDVPYCNGRINSIFTNEFNQATLLFSVAVVRNLSIQPRRCNSILFKVCCVGRRYREHASYIALLFFFGTLEPYMGFVGCGMAFRVEELSHWCHHLGWESTSIACTF